MVYELFSWAWSKQLTANQISGLLNQLYLNTNWVNQHDFLHYEID